MRKNKAKHTCLVGVFPLVIIILFLSNSKPKSNAQIFMIRAILNDRVYYLAEDINYKFEINKAVGEDNGYYLYSAVGDFDKLYKVLIMSDNDSPPQVFKERDFEIPQDGEVSGVLIVDYDYRLNTGLFYKVSEDSEVFKDIFDISNKKKVEIPKDVSEFDFYEIYYCYENCPVSGSYAGMIGKKDAHYLVIPNIRDPLYITGEGEQRIKEQVEYYEANDEVLKKLLKKVV